MRLNQVPQIDMRPGDNKFLVAELTDRIGNKRMVIRTGSSIRTDHRGILASLQEEVDKLGLYANAKPLGGGSIKIKMDQKTIRVYDYSVALDVEPDRDETVRMLQAAFPEFQVTQGGFEELEDFL